jgi:hypothetical protein
MTFLPQDDARLLLRRVLEDRLGDDPVKVTFQKRTNNALRVMRVTRVPDGQMGASVNTELDAAGADTAFVWDADKQKPASIPLERVMAITVGRDRT